MGLKLDQLPNPGTRFTVLEEIGSGVCGKVFKAIDTQSNGKLVAIKIQVYDIELRDKIEEEYRVLRDHSSHANLPNLLGVYKKKAGSFDEIWFVLELCAGGSIMNLIQKMHAVGRRMTEQQIAYILREVAKVVMYLHKDHIMHRDIRGSNVLVTSEGEIKLCDFGLSKYFESTMGKLSTCIGSPNWMAPEMFTVPAEPDDKIYGSRADVWALGILAIEIGDGHPPFHEMHPTRTMFQIVRNPPPTLYRPSNWSQNFNDFIAECLEKNPDNRPFMVELLEHPFFTELPEQDFHFSQELKVLLGNMNAKEPKPVDEEVAIFRGGLKKHSQSSTKMFVEDLCAIDKITEQSVLDTFKVRLEQGNSFTYAGDVLISLNSNCLSEEFMKNLQSKYMSKTRSENSPNIFAISDRAHQDMLHHEDPQYVVISGETYSGKTTMFKHVLDQLCYIGNCGSTGAGSKNAGTKILQSVAVLQAFISAGTPINRNSTRACLMANITFGKTGRLSGVIHSVYLLEKSRVCSTDMDQSNFHIFYYFYDAMQARNRLKDFLLDNHRQYRYMRISETVKPNYVRNTPESNVEKFQEIETALVDLEFSPEELTSIYKNLASIILLGELRFKESEKHAGKAELENHEVAANVARLLQVDEKKFIWALVNYCLVVSGKPERRRHSVDEARDARDVLASIIYTRVVDWVTSIINQKMAVGRAIFGDQNSVTVLDMFGFECYRRNQMDQFVINSINEQMQYFYNQRMFVWEMIEQEEEQIPAAIEFHFYDNKLAVDQIMSKPYGLLHILDDATRGRHDADYLTHLISTKKMQYVKRVNNHDFSVAHYTGKITYDSRDFLDKNREFLPPEMVETLRMSGDNTIKIMFSNPLTKTGNLTLAFEDPPKPKQAKGKWAGALVAEKTRIKKLNTLSNGLYSQIHKMRTQCSIFRATCLELMKTLSVSASNSGVHFVRCIRINLDNKPNEMQPDMVTQQIRAMAIIDTANSGKKGYPYRIPFQEFLRRYKFLAFEFNENVELTRDNCRLLLIRLKMEGWVIGKTKVFLKYYNVEYLARLYESQVKKIVKVQAMMRAFLAKRDTAGKLKKQIMKKKQNSVESIREAEKAATFIQKVLSGRPLFVTITCEDSLSDQAYRGYLVRKQYGPLINSKTGKIDSETASFIRPFASRWKSKSLYQVLLQYRAARHQDLVHFMQQIHIFNQAFLNSLRKTSSCVLLERIDPHQNSKCQLGPVGMSVWKLPFRLDEIPFFDSSFLCDLQSGERKSGYESDEECWDAPLKRRSTLSSKIAASSNQARNYSPFEGQNMYDEPFSRDIVYRRSPSPRLNNHQRSPQRVTERIGEINSRDNFVVYKKRTYAPPPPSFMRPEPERPASGGFGYKKRSAPLPPKSYDDNRLENRDRNAVYNPIRELQMIAGQREESEGDDPPFNFQAVLRKTEYNRASMKRNQSSKSPPNIGITTPRIRTPDGNVVYSSKMNERPRSCIGMNKNELDLNRNGMGNVERKHSLQQDGLLTQSSERLNCSTSRRSSDFNNNGDASEQYIKEEIAPGVFLEGYIDEV